MKYKHLFFDMDQTLTPSRQEILPEMLGLVSSLPTTITIVSGSTVEQIGRQIKDLSANRLGQNGNHAVSHQGEDWWYEPLTDQHTAEIMSHIEALVSLLDHDLNHEWDPIEHRGAQITFSPIGNTAPVEHKKSYDPDRMKREALLKAVPFQSEEIIIKIGGSTSFDYLHKDKHKGRNIERLIKQQNWNTDECIYFGDGLFPGGNDEAVIGVIETVPVENHYETYKKLKKVFELL